MALDETGRDRHLSREGRSIQSLGIGNFNDQLIGPHEQNAGRMRGSRCAVALGTRIARL
jgi:hypothetical protein